MRLDYFVGRHENRNNSAIHYGNLCIVDGASNCVLDGRAHVPVSNLQVVDSEGIVACTVRGRGSIERSHH